MNECQWFAMCHNECCASRFHPTVGWVPICRQHLDWLGDNPSPTQMIPPITAKHAARLPADMMEG